MNNYNGTIETITYFGKISIHSLIILGLNLSQEEPDIHKCGTCKEILIGSFIHLIHQINYLVSRNSKR